LLEVVDVTFIRLLEPSTDSVADRRNPRGTPAVRADRESHLDFAK
jgi:hypothetical protein